MLTFFYNFFSYKLYVCRKIRVQVCEGKIVASRVHCDLWCSLLLFTIKVTIICEVEMWEKKFKENYFVGIYGEKIMSSILVLRQNNKMRRTFLKREWVFQYVRFSDTYHKKCYAFRYFYQSNNLPRALIPSTIDIIRLKLKLEKSNMFFQQAFINMQVTRCISGLFECI